MFLKYVLFLLLLSVLLNISCSKVDSLIKEGRFREAEECCNELKVNKRENCLKKIAFTYKKAKKYNNAIEIYSKIDDTINVRNCYKHLADNFYLIKQYDSAASLYDSAGLHDKKAECFLKIADSLSSAERYEEAIIYYEKIDNSVKVELCKEKMLPLPGQWSGGGVDFVVSDDRSEITYMQIARPYGGEAAVDWVNDGISIKNKTFSYYRSGNSFLGIPGFDIKGTFTSNRTVLGKLNGKKWEASHE